MRYTLLSLLVFTPVVILSQSGMLDPTFGNNGISLTDIGSSNDNVEALVIQPDGRIVVAGITSAGSNGSIFLCRYLADGSPDPSFGTFGKVTTDLTSQGDGATDLLLQPDDKLIAIGFSDEGAAGFTAVRYLPDGAIDTTFGSMGVTVVPFGAVTGPKGALQSDGRILMASKYEPSFDLGSVRLTADGDLDTTYGSAGMRIFDSGSLNAEYLTDAMIQNDDKFVILSNTGSSFSDGLICTARLTIEGELDPTFSVDGTATVNLHTGTFTNEVMNSICELPDGRLLLAGDDQVNGSSVMRMTRMYPDGSLDLSFGTGASVLDSLPGFTIHGYSIGLQSDGRIVVVGGGYDLTSNENILLWRFNANGTLDPGFGTNGRTWTNIGTVDHVRASAIGVERIYASGWTNPFATSDVFVAAYSSGLILNAANNAAAEVPDDHMRISPDPATDRIVISGIDPAHVDAIRIVDGIGRCVASLLHPIDRSDGDRWWALDISTLPSSIYHVIVARSSGRTDHASFIKQ